MTNPQVLIIGGGLSGLSTAWSLARRGIRVEVWEADHQPGGKIRSTREQGYLTERAAGLLVNFRPQVDQLIEAAGLDDSRRGRSKALNRYVVHRGELARVPMQLPAMALSPLWSTAAKLRLLGEILIPRGSASGESVSSFIRRRLGQEILETAIDPFVAGTLASDPRLASAEAVLPRLTALEQRYGSITLGMLVNRVLKRRRANQADTFSFQGGMGELIQALSTAPGVRLRTGMRAEGMEPAKHGWQVFGTDGGRPCRCHAGQLVISTPAAQAGALLAPLDRHLAACLREIPYAPLAVLHLGLRERQIRHPLDGTGFLVPRREKLPFNGNLWMSSLFPDRAPAGCVLLTSYLGGARNPRQVEKSREQLAAETLHGLAPLLGLHGDPEYVRLDRHERALPLYHGDYAARTRRIREQVERLPGVHIAANYLDGVSVRERLYQGLRTASRIERELSCGERSPGDADDAEGLAAPPAPQPTGG